MIKNICVHLSGGFTNNLTLTVIVVDECRLYSQTLFSTRTDLTMPCLIPSFCDSLFVPRKGRLYKDHF